MARGLKFRILEEEELYYLCSENKGVGQLRDYREADLRLCFRICKNPVSYNEAHIFQTAGGATWTETIKNTATTPAVIDSTVALSNFRTWMNSVSGDAGDGTLPDHDHAMLFTRQIFFPSSINGWGGG